VIQFVHRFPSILGPSPDKTSVPSNVTDVRCAYIELDIDEPADELLREGQRRTFLPPADIACSLYSTFLGTQTVVIAVLTRRGHCGGKVIRGSVRVGHLKTSVLVNAGGRAEKANFFRGIPVTAQEKLNYLAITL
jgi:hypothetical protein